MHNNNDECDKRVPAKNDSSSKKPTGLFHDTFSFFGFLRFIRLFRIDAKNTEIKINSFFRNFRDDSGDSGFGTSMRH